MTIFKKAVIRKGVSVETMGSNGVPVETFGMDVNYFARLVKEKNATFKPSKYVSYKYNKPYDTSKTRTYVRLIAGNVLKYAIMSTETCLDVEQGLITWHGLSEEQKEQLKNHTTMGTYAFEVNTDFVLNWKA